MSMDPYSSELLLTTARTVRALLTYLAEEGDGWPSRREAKILLSGLDEALESFRHPRSAPVNEHG